MIIRLAYVGQLTPLHSSILHLTIIYFIATRLSLDAPKVNGNAESIMH